VSSTAGNQLIAVVVEYAPSTNVLSSVSGGGTWTVNANGTTTSILMKVGFASCPSATGGSQTITVTWASGSGTTAFILEFSGLQASPIFEGAGSQASGTSTTPTTNALSNTQASAVKIAGAVIDATNNAAWTSTGTGWTLPTNGSEPDGVSWLIAACGYKIVTSAQSDTESWSRSGSNAWQANITTYLTATAATVAPPPFRRPYRFFRKRG
jgi:hypothetical protein